MAVCVIFGGAGYIGTHLTRYLLSTKRFDHVHLADIRQPDWEMENVSSSITDVRQPIPKELISEQPTWIFNFAAIHREPGHEPHEYFDTNLAGARNVCAYADAVGCENVFFTSSISVYGPTIGPTTEEARICPNSPYGGSKYPAEVIHELWLAGAPEPSTCDLPARGSVRARRSGEYATDDQGDYAWLLRLSGFTELA